MAKRYGEGSSSPPQNRGQGEVVTATPRACRGFKFSRFGITHAAMPFDAFDYEGDEAGWFPNTNERR
jgi:hypothetical protein